jgi:hypothetical protein
MAKTQIPAPMGSSSSANAGWTGWVVFASIMLTVVGAINLMQGFIALFQDDYFLVPSGDDLLLLDFTAWGWVMLVWGAGQVLAGMGLNGGHGWARVAALIIACVSILIQILFLAAYPIWGTIIIALDVIVIYALTARWGEAKAGL